jgi:hypothetical protein
MHILAFVRHLGYNLCWHSCCWVRQNWIVAPNAHPPDIKKFKERQLQQVPHACFCDARVGQVQLPQWQLWPFPGRWGICDQHETGSGCRSVGALGNNKRRATEGLCNGWKSMKYHVNLPKSAGGFHRSGTRSGRR